MVWGPSLGSLKKSRIWAALSNANHPTLLLQGEGGDPDGEEAILPIRQTELGMADDFQEELTAMAAVGELMEGRSAEGNPTKDKRPSLVGEFLLVILPLFANQLDGVEVFPPPFRESDGRQDGLNRVKGRTAGGGKLVAPPFASLTRNVRKP